MRERWQRWRESIPNLFRPGAPSQCQSAKSSDRDPRSSNVVSARYALVNAALVELNLTVALPSVTEQISESPRELSPELRMF